MNIQSISELSSLTADIASLSNASAYLEISKPANSANGSEYNSYKLDLNTFLKSIVDMINYLSNQIINLNNQTDTIRASYVPLTGNALITGPIEIRSNSNTETSASLMVRGPLAIRGNLDIRQYDPANAMTPVLNINTITDNNTKYVVVNGKDVQLHCSTNIDGCALSAKWC